MWATLLTWMLGLLGELLIAFIQNAQAVRADDPRLIEYLNSLVTTIDTAPGLTGQVKRDYVTQNLRAYAATLSIELTDSLMHALVEVSLQRLRTAQGKAPA